jgi:hypothetical protein
LSRSFAYPDDNPTSDKEYLLRECMHQAKEWFSTVDHSLGPNPNHDPIDALGVRLRINIGLGAHVNNIVINILITCY